MLFKEMKEKYDSYGAFSNFMTISDAKAVGILPTAFHSYFPDKCECGSERLISVNLRQMQCTDPRCPIKQALALSNLFANFGCKGVGEMICKQAYMEVTKANNARIAMGEEPILQSNSYLEILNLDRSVYSLDFVTSAAGDTFLRYAEYIKTKTLTFPEMISKLGLPELETSAIKLFANINSFQEFKEAVIAEGGVSAYCEHRGFHDPMKKYWLYVSLEDIYVASMLFAGAVRAVGLQDEQICITGSIYPNGSRMTKKDFIEYCNQRANTIPVKDMLEQVILENEIQSVNKQTIEDLCFKLKMDNCFQAVDDSLSADEFIKQIKDISLLANTIQLFEIRLSTAKMSALHIIADAVSSTDKYKTGLARGIEHDASGREIKVLISSDEYLEEIERRKEEWTQQYKQELLTILKPSENLTPLQSMNLGI